MTSSTIEDGVVVLIQYTLRNLRGVVLDRSEPGQPLPYLHGAGNIIPGLERQLVGLSVGASGHFTVPPEEGYGLRQGEPMPVPRAAFPEGVEIMPGMQFSAQDPQGQLVPFWVVKVTEDEIVMDPNHPLAGETLVFEAEVMGLRPPSDEEVAHGHPHGVMGDEGHHDDH